MDLRPLPNLGKTRRIMIVAGEMSGDQHAARLVRAARAEGLRARFYGIGGDALRAEGVETLVDAREMAVLGFSEVIAKYRTLKRAFDLLANLLRTDPPDALLLVDYPGFNLRLAKIAKAARVPVWYYISPQVWAWNRARIPRMARLIDHLLVIFPFEPAVFASTPLPVTFVGHPLVESVRKTLAAPPADLPWPGAGGPRVAILPGSRRQEIARILPLQLAAAQHLLRHPDPSRPGDPPPRFLVAAATEEAVPAIQALLDRHVPPEFRPAFAVLPRRMREIARQADAAMVCSGTATVETALCRCPMIVVYRAAWPTYFLGRLLIRVKWLGMVNLVAGRTVCPEFIQRDATPAAMAAALRPLLTPTPARQAQLDALDAVAAALAGDGSATPPGRVVARLAAALP